VETNQKGARRRARVHSRRRNDRSPGAAGDYVPQPSQESEKKGKGKPRKPKGYVQESVYEKEKLVKQKNGTSSSHANKKSPILG